MMLSTAIGFATILFSAAGKDASYALDAIPEGFHLQACDDCGVPDRQPHIVHNPDVTSYAFPPEQVAADEKARTVATHPRELEAVYRGLDPSADYAIAVTYANEAFNHRSQSLWAGGIMLHGAHPLPKGGSERLLFHVPPDAIKNGTLTLRFKLEDQVNVVVSAIELWATLPSPEALYLAGVTGLAGDIEGKVLGLSYDGQPGVDVELAGGATVAHVTTGPDGSFSFARDTFDHGERKGLDIVARSGGAEARHPLDAEDLYFEPVRYRPMPADETSRLSLDGTWQIDGGPECQVPGQWLQEGFDVPIDRHVTMSCHFDIPEAWKGQRIFLRFEAIHAGTHYTLNGQELGYSENLFTPVEWEITSSARIGAPNTLVLDMLVDTVSEKLSYSCGYAFHNLGGIDRPVWIYTLPQRHLRNLAVNAGLDDRYENGTLSIQATIDNPDASATTMELAAELIAPDGSAVALSRESSTKSVEAPPGLSPVSLAFSVEHPQTWNAEQPALYRLAVTLRERGQTVERILRTIGFRRIEVRGAQLYVNGRRVKLAGACHHELDPLTGRADTGRHAEEDVRLMQQANLNYIRTSHYPPTKELVDAADRLGMYVEVEAPFCWVRASDDMAPLRQVLTPVSAMVDYYRDHPCVIVWSLANESAFNRCFEVANRVCKDLDPTRPTTFNNPDPKRVCDIANVHYPPMPYDEQLPGDPRPIFLGEYFFPICHEQTDVRIDPGLRELWGHGHSAPDSEWGKFCASSFDATYTHPGTPPGAWTHIYNSDRVIGGAIWAAIDEPYFLPDGRKVGYAWHHGFWGLIDTWRRPKPEWYLAKQIFSPVWFPQREVEPNANSPELRVPIENRYAFTNLNDLSFACNGKPCPSPDVPPGAKGFLNVPRGAQDKELAIRVSKGADEIVSTTIGLGKKDEAPLPRLTSPPSVQRDGNGLAVIGQGSVVLVFDTARGELKPDDPRHTAAVLSFPSVHLTRFDFGDLAPGPPYAVLPELASRTVDHVEIEQPPEGVAITVRDHYADLSGEMCWTIDCNGVGMVSYDYVYSGEPLKAREVGIRIAVKPECDRLRWNRWSEWGDFPEDAICRARGEAKAWRDPAAGPDAEERRPNWPWSLDQTKLGTNDFRSIKFNIYEASLSSVEGFGIHVNAHADTHARACVQPNAVLLHVLSDCRLGPVQIPKGAHIKGRFSISLLPQP